MIDNQTKEMLGWLGKMVQVKINDQDFSHIFRAVTFSGEGDNPNCTCYLYRVRTSSSQYLGRVTAIISCEMGKNFIILISSVGEEHYEPWIRKDLESLCSLQETRLFCLFEKSCGVIPYRIKRGKLEYLALFQSGSSTWSFPKGHMEYGEDEIQTAKREVKEEIGIDIDIPKDFRCQIIYNVHNNRAKKTVVLYAVPFSGEIHLREGEIGSYKWLNRYGIQKLFGHKELYSIFNKLEKLYREPKEILQNN